MLLNPGKSRIVLRGALHVMNVVSTSLRFHGAQMLFSRFSGRGNLIVEDLRVPIISRLRLRVPCSCMCRRCHNVTRINVVQQHAVVSVGVEVYLIRTMPPSLRNIPRAVDRHLVPVLSLLPAKEGSPVHPVLFLLEGANDVSGPKRESFLDATGQQRGAEVRHGRSRPAGGFRARTLPIVH